MAPLILSDARLWLGKYDLSGDANALALDYGAEPKDVTTIAATTRIFTGGLKTITANHEGLWEAGVGTVDEALFAGMGSTHVMTIAPAGGGAAGAAALFATVQEASYALGGAIGEAFPFSVQCAGAGALTSGKILHNGTSSTSAVGTGYEMGSPTSSQRWSAALHVLSITGGGSLTVDVQSDTASGFPSTTSRGSFAAVTAPGAEIITALGYGGADTWWRTTWSLTGTSPSATFIVAFGFI